jgi:membrane-associated phospholipid phosphatase
VKNVQIVSDSNSRRGEDGRVVRVRGITRIDDALERRMSRARTHRLISLLGHAASRGGDIAPLIYAVIWVRNDKKSALKSASLVLVQAVLINYVIKPMFKRERPDLSAKTSSFPSGHAAAAVSSAIVAPGRRGVMTSVAIGTSLGRMVRGAHWFSDVVAGSVIGAVSAYLFRRVTK